MAVQPNHERLVDFIRRNLKGESSLEFYGMWEADFSMPALSDQSVPLERLLELDFHFRDRGHYSINMQIGELDGPANGSQPLGPHSTPASP